MSTLALTELLGATVYDPSGAAGRVREATVAPQEDRSRIASLIVKTKTGNRLLPFTAISAVNGGIRTSTSATEWPAASGTEGLFLLERDLLDQQVIDVNGRKVVRVNDVDIEFDAQKAVGAAHLVMRVLSVDVGARGAVRRLLTRSSATNSVAGLAGKNPSPQHSLEVCRSDRDGPGAPGEAQDFA